MKRHAQYGQSIPGYVVILTVCAIVLFTGDPSPAEFFAEKMREFYASYSHFLSLP